ncbi:MAG: hypothetical protein F4133_04170 [Gammaproteobacteria bacterium]|nr:hypothetical protein [Gammaproteobacteria bacterium]
MRLQPVFVDVLPEFQEIETGQLWISHKHRTVNLRCPCGCDELTVLTLHPSRWHIHFDGKTVSLAGPTGGSIWANSGCGSHYFIRKNEVIWLDTIDPRRHAEYAVVERSRMVARHPNGETGSTWAGRVWRGVSSYLRSCLRRP